MDRTHVVFADHRTGRTWTANTIDEFIVGRIYGGYDLNQIQLYLTYNNSSLVGITVNELDDFWNTELAHPDRTLISYWTLREIEDPQVQRVLNMVNLYLGQAQTLVYEGRQWISNAVNEFIVGRIHGGYDINQILLYLPVNNRNLVGITAQGLERFWTNVLQSPNQPHIPRWAAMPRDDPRVQMMLDSISTTLARAQTAEH